MTIYEILYGGLNLLTIVITAVMLLRAPNRMLFWSPLLFYTFTWGFYSAIGPGMVLLTGNAFDRGRDMRPFLEPALLAGLISYLTTLFGYRVARGHLSQGNIPLRLNRLWLSRELGKKVTFIGVAVMALGFGMFCIVVGWDIVGMLNPFKVAGAGAGYAGAFSSYFIYGIQLFVPGCILLLLATRRYPPARFYFAGALLLTGVLYLQQGFRYRLVLLVGGLMVAYYLDRWKRPNVLFQTIVLACTIFVMGFIGITREYGLGLQVDRLEGAGLAEIFQSGAGDSGIFFTSGAIIDVVPESLPYALWAPIKGALLMPIPRGLYNSKDTSSYLELLIEVIYGEGRSTGASYMFFAEWYYAFGWAGLVAASWLLGYAMGRLWRWFLRHSDNLFAIAIYACLMPFSYVVLSRGYLSQVLMLFAFAAGPIYLLYRFNLKRLNGAERNARMVGSRGMMPATPRPTGQRL